MKVKLVVLIIISSIFSGCAFHVGIDWQGETKKDNRTYSGK